MTLKSAKRSNGGVFIFTHTKYTKEQKKPRLNLGKHLLDQIVNATNQGVSRTHNLWILFMLRFGEVFGS